MHRTGLFIPVVFSLLCACGLEDAAFLYAVPEGKITATNARQVYIDLPSPDAVEALYFTHFVFFYRIYISGAVSAPGIPITTATQMASINPALASDFNSLYSYTSSSVNNTTVNTSTSLFTSRRYYDLALEGSAIESVLGAASPGKQLLIDFRISPPVLSLDGGTTTINLRRSTGGGTFEPVPDRYFINRPDLYDSSNAIPTKNADTAAYSSPASSSTYVSLYIAKMGRDAYTLSSVYSVPTFVGVFELPN